MEMMRIKDVETVFWLLFVGAVGSLAILIAMGSED